MHVKSGEFGETLRGNTEPSHKELCMKGKELILTVTEGGCIVPTSHKLNKDGYFRKFDSKKSSKGNKVWTMYHRQVWEEEYGPIPEGWEINHKCLNRACCNLKHLECIPGNEHATLSNLNRYLKRYKEAYSYWNTERCTGTQLAKVFNVTTSCACRWVRSWKV